MSELVMNDPYLYQALVVKQGLKACKIGMRLNRAYTPKNLFAMVEKITGKSFKRGQYDEAISALQSWIDIKHTETLDA